jgi:hypothetical protein
VNAGGNGSNAAGGETAAKDSGSVGGGKTGSAPNKSGPVAQKDPVPTMTLRAPFVVVDSAGKAIFRVNDPHAVGGSKSGGERGVYVYGEAGKANFQLQTVYEGAKFVALSDSGEYVATFGAVSTDAGIRIRKGAITRAFVGMDSGGKGNISIATGPDDKTTVGMQVSALGKPMVAVFSDNNAIAFLTQSAGGGGNITATDAAGVGLFSAGHVGGQDGETCVNRKHSLHCLGIGLPLSGE